MLSAFNQNKDGSIIMTKSKFFLAIFSMILISSGARVEALTDSSGSEPRCDRIEHDWHKLQRANEKFIDSPKYAKQRAETAGGQNPTYVVLSCADSRTPPELIFNQGLGRIFCPRVAGNTAGDQVIDSIAFAVNTWDVTTVVVMGHTSCGAVEGALARLRKNCGKIDRPNGLFNAVLIPIERAIVWAGIDIYADDALERATEANVAYVAERLIKKSSIIRKAVEKGQIIIVGSIYSVETGQARQLFILENCKRADF